MTFVIWPFRPDQVQVSVNIYMDQLNENVNLETVTTDYFSVLEVKLLGQDLDMAMGFRAVIECESCGQRGWFYCYSGSGINAIQGTVGEWSYQYKISHLYLLAGFQADRWCYISHLPVFCE